jgi:hypothetical protein
MGRNRTRFNATGVEGCAVAPRRAAGPIRNAALSSRSTPSRRLDDPQRRPARSAGPMLA